MENGYFHFKNYGLAQPLISGIKPTYNVFQHLTKSVENGLEVTFEIKKEYLAEYLQLIESFGLETY